MPKLSLLPINSRYGSLDALNDNFDSIEEAIENTLSRDGTTPNEMEANLDMNGFSILNAATIQTGGITINGVTITIPNEGNVAAASALVQYLFTATNGQTSFSVSPYTPTAATTQVFVNGIHLMPSDISISDNDVVVPPLEAGDEVAIYILASAINSSAQYNLSSYVPTKTVTTATYNITADDYGYFIIFDRATAQTITITNDASDFVSNRGASFIFVQKGDGQVTLQAGSGVTLLNASSNKTRAKNSVMAAQCIADGSWIVFGDME